MGEKECIRKNLKRKKWEDKKGNRSENEVKYPYFVSLFDLSPDDRQESPLNTGTNSK